MAHIACYIDSVSFYSYLAFDHLVKRRDVLATHGVTLEFIPFFLGAVNNSSGNKPPWTLPAKQQYGQFDFQRALKHFDLPGLAVPPFFPSSTLLAQRALCYVKATYPRDTYERLFARIFHLLWTPPHSNIGQEDALRDALLSVGPGLFSAAEVETILVKGTEKEWKDCLLENTKAALEKGAFGAPWMWVRNAEGKEEPFFGSDRFHFMWEFLGLPYTDVQLLPAAMSKL